MSRPNLKTLMGTATLILGILSILLPLFVNIATLLVVILISERYIGYFLINAAYVYTAAYFVIVILGGTFGIIDLLNNKPRLWHKENMKTLIGLSFIILSLAFFGRLIIGNEFFQHNILAR
jgi:hypothetical protein